MKSAIFKTLIFLFITGCAGQSLTQPSYLPGLGEIMAQISYRHGKLWFAGQAQNWALAAYELEEIEEGLADASQYHPSHKTITGIPRLILQTMDNAIKQTAQGIRNKNVVGFNAGYDALTAGCNVCHQATGFGFNVIVKPQKNVFSNQQF